MAMTQALRQLEKGSESTKIKYMQNCLPFFFIFFTLGGTLTVYLWLYTQGSLLIKFMALGIKLG